MVQRGERLRLALEAQHAIGVGGEDVGQQLDGDVAMQASYRARDRPRPCRRRRSAPTISYEPIRAPLDSDIRCLGLQRSLPCGHRTTSPVRICGTRKCRAFPANMPACTNVHSSPHVSISRSMPSATSLEGFGCWKNGCGVLSGAVRNTIAVRGGRFIPAHAPQPAGGATHTTKTVSTSSRHR